MAEAKPLIKAQIAEDQSAVRVSFPAIPAGSRSMSLSFERLTELIRDLGQVRTQMQAARPVAPIEGAQVEVTFNVPWYTQLDPLSEQSVIAFQHASFGPVGLLLTASDAEKLSSLLSRQSQAPRQSSSDQPN